MLAVPVAKVAAVTTTSITIDGSKSGHVFQGIGAISGGGGNSRLLIDYPEPQRSQILDYLFKPGYGASLQMLKLEIGGDANSTDGAEPSAEHVRGQVNCASGYEWWIAKQAVARNPAIKLSGLQWAAPGWTGTWTQADIQYLLNWLGCARSNGLTISYLGGWNERTYSAPWFVSLRQALDAAGYGGVQIVAADGSTVGNTTAASQALEHPGTAAPLAYNANAPWAIANDMAANPALRAAIGVIGAHDTCGYPTEGYTCTSTATARSLGKPLWESELGAMNRDAGAPKLARAINNGYNQATITGYLEWPLITSMPPGIRLQDRGLITASQPWSGNYRLNRMLWATAQTTQFAPAGWRHVGGANRSLAGGGTYNTYQASNHSGWSMAVETTEAPASQPSQNITVRVTGGLPSSRVHIRATNLWSTNPASWFVQWKDIYPAAGTFTYSLPRGYAVTFSTTTAGGKGTAASPPVRPMPAASGLLPETASSAGDGSGQPALLSPMDGAFGYAPCGDGSGLNCVQQQAAGTPTWWWGPTSALPRNPYAVLGDDWTGAYTVAGQLLLRAGQTAGIIGRFSNQTDSRNPQLFRGYELTLSASGNWKLQKNSLCQCLANGGTLKSGTVTAPTTWTSLSLTMSGGTITASIGATQVAKVTDNDPNYTHGAAGVITGGWYGTSFRNMSIVF
ncbi:MAG: galactosylceramidase [Micromonosporaceae bacterium]